MNISDIGEKRIAWAVLILSPVSMAFMCIYISAGFAPGIDAGHPVEYLIMTCIIWGMIMMVLPILRLLKVVALPIWFVALLYSDMYLYVVSLSMGMYLNISWWGDFTHIVASIIVTAIIFIALCLMHVHSPPHVTFGSRGGIVVMLMVVASSFGAIWEIMEGYTDILSGTEYMSYGAMDTLGDLTADLIGVVIMTSIAFIILSKNSVKDIVSKIRIGKKMFGL